MVNGTCQLCKKTLKYCDTCSSDKVCTKCSIPELVVLSNNNTCGCPFGNNSFFDDSSSKCMCKTDFYLRNKTCSQCDSVIPKCDSCSYASGLTTGIKLDDGGTLQCANCGYGKFLETSKYQCQECSKKFFGCGFCGSTGSVCTKCLPEYLANVVNNRFTCVLCRDYMSGCKTCNSQSQCTSCLDDFNMVFGYCFKKWFWLSYINLNC